MVALEVDLCRAEARPADALAAFAAADGRLNLVLDPRYTWPLLAATARAAAAVSRGAPRDAALAAQAAGVLARLRELAAQMPAFGPVQQANRLTFGAEALRAGQ